MSELDPATARTASSRHWLVVISRAVVALAVGIAITFSSDHSSIVGFVAFGVFAILSAFLVGYPGARVLEAGVERRVAIAQGVVSLLAGIAALILHGSDVALLLFLLSAWAAVTGFLELYLGIRSRGRRATSRDWTFAGVLTAVLALVVLLVPSDYSQPFVGPDGVARELSAAIIVVGLFGAYAAILGVYLAIAGLSLKWASAPAPAASAGKAS